MRKKIGTGKRVFAAVMTGAMMMSFLGGCSDTSVAQGSPAAPDQTSSTESTAAGSATEAASGEKEVLRVGMECAYPPFNWTQDAPTTPDGSSAVQIYGSTLYTYGYDVAVAEMLAEQMGMELEIHKVEWSSIGISMDAGDYDCIIAGMGRTAEREMSYSFTTPYYYRDNCIVVNLADQETCVIVGKCADYVLRDRDNVVSVYIEAPRAFCLQRTIEHMGVTADVANATITRTDKFRADYYAYYTHGNYWTNPVNYDMTLNSERVGIESCVKIIEQYLIIKGFITADEIGIKS